ncbi:hypothetical protein ACROYT_G014266 [Oculina patagonica]
MQKRKEDLDKLSRFRESSDSSLSQAKRHEKELSFMADNSNRQLVYPRIGTYPDCQRPEPVHNEINVWQHVLNVIYQEALPRELTEDVLEVQSLPLQLLTSTVMHVTAELLFIRSVEYPDEDLITLLSTYGELKSNRVHRLRFSEEGYDHIENGVRVVEFLRIDHDISKRVSLGGLDIGFKYSGQPVTCHGCHSLEHVVKNCPSRRRNPVQGRDRSSPENGDENTMEVQTTPPSESTLTFTMNMICLIMSLAVF